MNSILIQLGFFLALNYVFIQKLVFYVLKFLLFIRANPSHLVICHKLLLDLLYGMFTFRIVWPISILQRSHSLQVKTGIGKNNTRLLKLVACLTCTIDWLKPLCIHFIRLSMLRRWQNTDDNLIKYIWITPGFSYSNHVFTKYNPGRIYKEISFLYLFQSSKLAMKEQLEHVDSIVNVNVNEQKWHL